ncbi:unnamed protein product [Rodentolepis nana]|uniref:NOT2_3_5 domain-containing protein n=1 Tax=Rodentolepis nana TaxID=102285 RepID=A0A0R3TC02_RODNA|nr:unnamed protein product [Rodentolepis nana]
MAGIGQRNTFEHPSSWNSAAQLGMGRNLHSDVQKNSSFQATSDKRSLLSNSNSASTLVGLNTNLNLNYNPRPSSSSRLKVQNSIGNNMRSNYNQESGADSNSLGLPNFGSGTNFPGSSSRGLSDPSLFMNTNSDLTSLMSNLNLNTKSSFTPINKPSSSTLGLLSSGGSINNSSNIQGVTSPGLTFDPSDFPPILNTANPSQSQNFPALSQSRNYVSAISKNPSNIASTPVTCGNPNSNLQSSPEFSIDRDFPALPGTQATNPTSITSSLAPPPVSSSSQSLNMATGESLLKQSQAGQRVPRSQSTRVPPGSENTSDHESVLQFLNENVVANIPPDMIDNQFGMIGLMKLIQIEPYFDTLAPGIKLPALGLSNCSLPGELHKVFGSPLNDTCVIPPHDLDYPVPPEYRIRFRSNTKLSPDPPLELLDDNTLFYIFYNFCKEELQLVAAKELYDRDWRYHKKKLRWLTRAQGSEVIREGLTETGTYYVYEPQDASRVLISTTLNYSDLDETPATYQLSSQTLNAKIQFSAPMPPQQPHLIGNTNQQLYFGQLNSRPSRAQVPGVPGGKVMPNGVLMQHQIAVAKPEPLNVAGAVSNNAVNSKPTPIAAESTSTVNVPTSSTNLPPTTSS